MNKLLQGDCLELMKDIPDGSVDMILCDLPYGTTACKWDNVIPFEPLWEQYNRIIKSNGAICLFGSEPFSSALRMSNAKMFRYDWIWEKTKAQGFLNAKKMPLKAHETISVFYKKLPSYNPQGLIRGNFRNYRPAKENSWIKGLYGKETRYGESQYSRYPRSVVKFSNKTYIGNPHVTAKPVPLLEYLIRTYTNEGETVLDNCMGSGSTGVACVNTNRNFIGIELDENYFHIAQDRINKAIADKGGE